MFNKHLDKFISSVITQIHNFFVAPQWDLFAKKVIFLNSCNDFLETWNIAQCFLMKLITP